MPNKLNIVSKCTGFLYVSTYQYLSYSQKCVIICLICLFNICITYVCLRFVYSVHNVFMSTIKVSSVKMTNFQPICYADGICITMSLWQRTLILDYIWHKNLLESMSVILWKFKLSLQNQNVQVCEKKTTVLSIVKRTPTKYTT